METRKNIQDLPGLSPCPVCATPIEKVDGCNHIHCSVPACQAHFCWGCMEMFCSELSAACDGVVEAIDEDQNRVWVRVDVESWSRATRVERVPPPSSNLCLQLSKLAFMVEGEFGVGTVLRSLIPTYVYDHTNVCSFHMNQQR